MATTEQCRCIEYQVRVCLFGTHGTCILVGLNPIKPGVFKAHESLGGHLPSFARLFLNLG